MVHLRNKFFRLREALKMSSSKRGIVIISYKESFPGKVPSVIFLIQTNAPLIISRTQQRISMAHTAKITCMTPEKHANKANAIPEVTTWFEGISAAGD
jgi:hypothetical protein